MLPRQKPELPVELSEELATIVNKLYGAPPADRAHAASRLGQLGPGAAPASAYLIDALSDPDWQVRREAAEALGAVGDSGAVESLIHVLSHEKEWGVRTAAARSLGELGDPSAVDPLVGVLNDMNSHVRHMAVIALGRIGTAEAVEPLRLAARSDHDSAVRFSAAKVLQEIQAANRD